MNSPDMNRLAAALAKLDDPDIISMLLEVVLPNDMRDASSQPSPTDPVQYELLGHVQDRKTKKLDRVPQNANRVWTRSNVYELRALVASGATAEDIADQMGRSKYAVWKAIQRFITDPAM